MFYLNRTYDLTFTGVLEGLEVKIKNTSVATAVQVTDTGIGTPAMAELLADHVIEWNWGDGDEPWPITVESFLNLELVVQRAIVEAWYEAATGVSAPLDPPSKDGAPSVEASIPMDVL